MVALSVNSAPSSHLGTTVPSAVSLSLRMSSPTHPEALQPCTLHVLTLKGLHRVVVLFFPTALRLHHFFLLLAYDHAPCLLSSTDAWLRRRVHIAQATTAESPHQPPAHTWKAPSLIHLLNFSARPQLVQLHLTLELQGLCVGVQHSKGIPFLCLFIWHSFQPEVFFTFAWKQGSKWLMSLRLHRHHLKFIFQCLLAMIFISLT